MFENINTFLNLAVSIISIFTAFLSILLIIRIISHKETYLKNKIIIVFGLLCVGFIFLAIAETLWAVLPFFVINPLFGFVDYIYIIGYIFIIISLACLIKICFIKFNLKKIISIILMGIFFLAVTIMLMRYLIIITSQGIPFFNLFTTYFYVIADSLIIVLSFSIYIFFKQFKFGKSLLLIAISFLCYYIGDLFYAYYSLRGISGLTETLSILFYFFHYILAFIALYILFFQLNKKKLEK